MIKEMNIIAEQGLMGKFQELFSTIQTALDATGSFGGYILAIVVFLVGRIVCRVIKGVVQKALEKTGIDDKIGSMVGHKGAAEGAIATFVYYILLLYVAILALGVAKLDMVSGPLKNMLSEFLNFIPSLVGAGVLLFVVLLVAKIVKNLASGVMSAAKLDERLGAEEGKTPISGALATALYCFILLLFIPAVLSVLNLESVSKPVGDVVDSILSAVPNIIIASVLVAVGILIGQIARRLVTNLLEAAGANDWPAKVGLEAPQDEKRSVSNIVGLIVMMSVVVLMLGAAINELNLDLLAGASEIFVSGFFNILLAVIILGAGILLSKFAYNALVGGNETLAKVAKYAILILVSVIALQRSGIAPGLTGLPYTVAIYALGVAFGIGGAVAIGLGGREYVSRLLEKKG